MRSIHSNLLTRKLLSVLGKLWTSPNSALGLLLGMLATPFGARVRCGDNAIQFYRFPLGPGGALVLGNVILLTGDSLDLRVRTYRARARGARRVWVRLGDHERAHTYQYEVLGPFFLPAYVLLGCLRGAIIAASNPFEAAADRYALTHRGWWPDWRSSTRPRRMQNGKGVQR